MTEVFFIELLKQYPVLGSSSVTIVLILWGIRSMARTRSDIQNLLHILVGVHGDNGLVSTVKRIRENQKIQFERLEQHGNRITAIEAKSRYKSNPEPD